MEARLNELREEFASGQKMLVDLQSRSDSLKQQLLRISGAAQVLEELLGKDTESAQDDSPIAACQ